ncbi:leucine--tRNA ligase [Patescibacteria group bacterium]|nr:leucine--tRNA ligase [Patescibacteria group bacterium]
MKVVIKKYSHQKIERKWQKFWATQQIFKATADNHHPKYYALDMFAYPSGDGLHVGHPRGYTATDILARYHRMLGHNVMRPVGWDAFGLPAENYAIKIGQPPAKLTKANIVRFSKQVKSLGFAYDWNRELNTADPSYYKWTQWIFKILYDNGYAYQKEACVNWCPKDKTVLANEQVVDGCCYRCGAVVEQKNLKQWFFKITDFADELACHPDKLDWPESTKTGQKNWVGKSEGAEIEFKIKSEKSRIKVFTTRPDTLFGATYLVLAPEHPLIKRIVTKEQKHKIEKYIKDARLKSVLDRTVAKEKTGVFTGACAINPATESEIPIWVADYVVTDYGTGAIMAVPAHDDRDFEFATKHKLPITEVVESDQSKLPYVGHGKLINSGRFTGQSSQIAGADMAETFGGKITVQYKLHDWLVSRQRYWGAPIPIIHLADGGVRSVDVEELPIKLPTDVDFKPTGESPLALSKKFQSGVAKKYGKGARRELDTMDTFVCSSWYFLRYCDPHNATEFAGAESLKHWMPVDLYIGGSEHTNGHLLYARFIVKVLHKLGYINFNEPFLKLRHQGLILGTDGEKMSKSKGNVINPDEVIEVFGADALRMYEMFMGPFDQPLPWNTAGIEGVRRFLNRVWSLKPVAKAPETDRAIHKLIKKVTDDIEQMKFNTIVSSCMEFVNLAIDRGITKSALERLVMLLAPMTPHIAEEIYQKLGHKQSIFVSDWPKFDPKLLLEDSVTVAVQVNGRLRGTLSVSPTADEAEVEKLAIALPSLATHIEGKKVVKRHYVPGRIINLIVK